MKLLPLFTLISALIFASSCGNTDAIDEEGSMTDPAEETVNYSLTTAIIPSDGGSVSPSGGEFEEGSEVTVEATAEPGFSFSSWDGDLSGNENPTVITMDSDKSVTAIFEEDSEIFSLTVSTDGSGTVSPGSGDYEEGTEVELTATADPGWSFIGWEGDLSGTTNPQTITMDSDKEVTAVFEDIRSEYSVMLTLSDGVDQIDLGLGQSANPEDESVYAPPSPPEGALDGRFERDEEEFFVDYRINTLSQVEWTLTYQQAEEDELTLTWGIEAVQMEGSLILSSSHLGEEVDMLEQSEVTFTGNDTGNFTIIYTSEN